MRKCHFFLTVGILLLTVMPAFAAETENPFSVTGLFAYGTYSRSDERRSETSEMLNATYSTAPDLGVGLNIYNSYLLRKAHLGHIGTTDYGVSGFKYLQAGTAGSFGGRISAIYVTSTDKNSDNTLIPYASIMYKTPDSGKYLDFGYANAGYSNTTVNQFTLTGGIELFDWWTWSQTRIYFVDLSKQVQSKSSTVAVEEKFTWHIMPKKLDLTGYLLIGERMFAYDPDLGIVYNLPDVQRESTGLTAAYNFKKNFTAYGEMSYASYKNVTTDNSYYGLFWTVGMKYTF